MNRAERRTRTANVVKRRVKESPYPVIPGKCKKKHPLDCGHTDCSYCRDTDKKPPRKKVIDDRDS
jgi:ornithine carbamoyltransferase